MGIEVGVLYVRRSCLIQATPERVWQEFTSFDRLAAWFGRGHTLEAYEPELGGQILSCTFCKRSEKQVHKLVAGPGVYICDRCTARAHAIIQQGGPPSGGASIWKRAVGRLHRLISRGSESLELRRSDPETV